ncbi:hypothetical protein Pcinc_035482 [Petrolisthes cinctipes]|uniref:Uncharacterized protein n=1 Tax=Petrolisthes cinctipes TaxID=88211 RepID=A0AAE1BWG4_PETCI|nr:hypothetical protein Pcinc_035482 [Petrolisthes cinctipes]
MGPLCGSRGSTWVYHGDQGASERGRDTEMDTEKAVLDRVVSLSASKSNNEDRKMVCRVHSERAEGNNLGALVVNVSRPVSLL